MKCMTAPHVARLGAPGENEPGNTSWKCDLHVIVKHGWDSDLRPFGKIRGIGFVDGKC